MTRRTADALTLLCAAIWGGGFYFQKEAMDHIGPFLFLALRAGLACVTLLPLALRETNERAGASNVWPYAAMGAAAFTIGGVLQQYGISDATLTNTSFLTALYVVLTPFLLWLLKHEQPGLRVWVAAVIAFVGIWLLGGGSIGAFSRGDLLIAASSLFWASYMVVAGASAKLARPFTYTCCMFACVIVMTVPGVLAFETVTWAAIKAAAPSLLFVGIISSAFTYTVMASVVRHVPASRAAVLISSEVLFGSAAGFIVLGERLSLIGWVGAGLMLVAILLVQTRTASAT